MHAIEIHNTFKFKDLVAFRTNQPQVHLLEMFGHEPFNPNDIDAEEHIGWIKAVISENEYLIVTISPVSQFVCLANSEDIVRKVEAGELTDEQRQLIHEFYMAPNAYINQKDDDEFEGQGIEERCCRIARKAMNALFPDDEIESVEFAKSDFIKENTINNLYWCIDNFAKNASAERKKELTDQADELAARFKTLRFKQYYSVNVGVRKYGPQPEIYDELDKLVAEQLGCDVSEIKSDCSTYFYLIAIDMNFEEVSIMRDGNERSAFFLSLGPEYDKLWNAKTAFAHECLKL